MTVNISLVDVESQDAVRTMSEDVVVSNMELVIHVVRGKIRSPFDVLSANYGGKKESESENLAHLEDIICDIRQ